jgi:hypothetical protein
LTNLKKTAKMNCNDLGSKKIKGFKNKTKYNKTETESVHGWQNPGE